MEIVFSGDPKDTKFVNLFGVPFDVARQEWVRVSRNTFKWEFLIITRFNNHYKIVVEDDFEFNSK